VALLADRAEALLMNIFFLVAVIANGSDRFVLASLVALVALHISVLAGKGVLAVLACVMVKEQVLPAVGHMTGVTDLSLELSVVFVLVTVLALFVLKSRVTPFGVAL